MDRLGGLTASLVALGLAALVVLSVARLTRPGSRRSHRVVSLGAAVVVLLAVPATVRAVEQSRGLVDRLVSAGPGLLADGTGKPPLFSGLPDLSTSPWSVPSVGPSPAAGGAVGSSPATVVPRSAATSAATVPPEATTTGPAVTAAVRTASRSVVRITGTAVACRQIQEGSGVVVAPERVMTNAHVVQGLRTLSIKVPGASRALTGRVVYDDPSIDVAVLRVPGLRAAPLTVASGTLPAGSLVVAAGYPLNGPLKLTPGVVRAVWEDAGPQVGSTPPRARPMYAMSAVVKEGNSGGPLLSPDGHVVGLVFARNATGAYSGFAITTPAVAPALAAGGRATRTVSTGTCVREGG